MATKEKDKNDEKVRRLPDVKLPQFTLPTEPEEADSVLGARVQLWHGKPKIGKTVTANNATDGTFFIRLESGHSHIRHYGLTANTWQELLGICNTLRQEVQRRSSDQNIPPLPYKTVCLDTAGMAFARCQEFILSQHRIAHESDLGYGKGYALIEREFRRVITKLCNLGFGVIMICHSTVVTETDETGDFQIVTMDLPKAAYRVIPPLADLILYFAVEKDSDGRWHRVIKTRRGRGYEAGVRYPPGWRRVLPETLPMSYQALEDAWHDGDPDNVADGPAAPSAPDEPSESDEGQPQRQPQRQAKQSEDRNEEQGERKRTGTTLKRNRPNGGPQPQDTEDAQSDSRTNGDDDGPF